MEIDIYNKKTFAYGSHKINSLYSLQETTTYDCFCFIKFNEKVILVFESVIKDKEGLSKYSGNIKDYIRNEWPITLSKYHYKDIQKFDIDFYAIPRLNKTQDTYRFFKRFIEKVRVGDNLIVGFIKLISNMLDQHKTLIYVMLSIIILIYSSMLYLVLTKVGIPLNIIDDMPSISTLYIFEQISIFLLPFTMILNYFVNLFTIETIINGHTFFAVFGISIIWFLIKKDDLFYKLYPFILVLRVIIGIIFQSTIFTLLGLILLGTFIFHILFLVDYIKNDSQRDFFNPIKIYTLYQSKTGYPKLLTNTQDNKQYILIGENSINYNVYSLDNVLMFVKDIKTMSNDLKLITSGQKKISEREKEEYIDKRVYMEQFCINIKDSSYNKERVTFEILAQSPKSKPKNINFLNIRRTEVTVEEFNFNKLNLDIEIIKNDCNNFSDVLSTLRVKKVL